MASDEFLGAFIVGGGPTEKCDFCGNTYYSTTTLEPEELEYYEKQRKLNPYKFHPEPYDTIEFYVLDDRKYVGGCSCNALDKYENFIWAHKKQILNYFLQRSELEYNEKEALRKQVVETARMHEVAKEVAIQLDEAAKALKK